MDNTKWWNEFNDRCILLGYRGSKVHGTWRPPTDPNSVDDVDIMGVIVGPREAYFGFGRQDTYERMEDDKNTGLLWDGVFYDVKKFISLLCKMNPNVLSMLWMQPNDYIKVTPLGRLILDNRSLFVSKEAHKAFSGYAWGQFKKMENCKCMGYMGAKRKGLVEKYGFDTKNASHLIRLLKMGIEFLSTGQLNVKREDNSLLVDIKNGKYNLDWVKTEAHRLFALADEALVRSTLPERVDVKKAEELLVEILGRHFVALGPAPMEEYR